MNACFILRAKAKRPADAVAGDIPLLADGDRAGGIETGGRLDELAQFLHGGIIQLALEVVRDVPIGVPANGDGLSAQWEGRLLRLLAALHLVAALGAEDDSHRRRRLALHFDHLCFADAPLDNPALHLLGHLAVGGDAVVQFHIAAIVEAPLLAGVCPQAKLVAFLSRGEGTSG